MFILTGRKAMALAPIHGAWPPEGRCPYICAPADQAVPAFCTAATRTSHPHPFSIAATMASELNDDDLVDYEEVRCVRSPRLPSAEHCLRLLPARRHFIVFSV